MNIRSYELVKKVISWKLPSATNIDNFIKLFDKMCLDNQFLGRNATDSDDWFNSTTDTGHWLIITGDGRIVLGTFNMVSITEGIQITKMQFPFTYRRYDFHIYEKKVPRDDSEI